MLQEFEFSIDVIRMKSYLDSLFDPATRKQSTSSPDKD